MSTTEDLRAKSDDQLTAELTELSGIGKAGLLQIASVGGGAISDRNLDEVVLVRVR